MNRDRFFRISLTLLALGLFCTLGGCKKEPFVQVVEQTLYLGMPASIETLASVDVEQLRLTDGFNELLKQMETSPKGKPQEQYKDGMKTLREQVGFDPWKDINRLVLGMRGAADPKKTGQNMIVLARGQFQNAPDKLKKLNEWLGEDTLADPKLIQSQHSSGIAKLQISGKDQRNFQLVELNFAFPNDTMMVFSPSSQQLNDALDVISGQIEGIQKDQKWLEMLKRPDIGTAIWATGTIPAATASSLAARLPEQAEQLRGIKQAYLDANFNPNFALHVGLVCENIDAATKLADKLRTQFEMYKGIGKMYLAAQQATQSVKMLDGIKILSELETARVSLSLTADDLRLLRDEWQKLGEKMAGQGGAMGGMPGMGVGGMPGAGAMAPFAMPGAGAAKTAK